MNEYAIQVLSGLSCAGILYLIHLARTTLVEVKKHSHEIADLKKTREVHDKVISQMAGKSFSSYLVSRGLQDIPIFRAKTNGKAHDFD